MGIYLVCLKKQLGVKMLKQILAILILSTIIIIFAHQFNQILHVIGGIYQLLLHTLQNVFAGGKLGHIIQRVIALLIPPFFVAGIVELILRLLKQDGTRFAMYGMWSTWLILLVLAGIH